MLPFHIRQRYSYTGVDILQFIFMRYRHLFTFELLPEISERERETGFIIGINYVYQ